MSDSKDQQAAKEPEADASVAGAASASDAPENVAEGGAPANVAVGGAPTFKTPERKQPEFLGMEEVSAGWLNKYILNYRLPDGNVHQYESVSRKPKDVYLAELTTKGAVDPEIDAVCIVGYTKDESFVMTREFRYPMNRYCVQFPAGLRERGENVIGCASREMREETGYDLVRDDFGNPVKTYYFVQPGYSSLGMGDESIAMVFALVEKVEEPHPEETECIDVFELPRKDVRRFLEANTDPISIRAQVVLEMSVYDPFKF